MAVRNDDDEDPLGSQRVDTGLEQPHRVNKVLDHVVQDHGTDRFGQAIALEQLRSHVDASVAGNGGHGGGRLEPYVGQLPRLRRDQPKLAESGSDIDDRFTRFQ